MFRKHIWGVRDMKKFFSILTIMLLFCTGCSTVEDNSKYPFDYLGVYDTLTRQYIELGDQKEHIDKVLGAGKSASNIDIRYRYVENTIEIAYDETEGTPTKNRARYINLNKLYIDKSRFEIPGKINYNSTVTDFIEKYPYAYSYDSVLFEGIKTFVKKTGDKYSFVDKSELEKIFSGPLNEGRRSKSDEFNSVQIYEIRINYASYSEITDITISEVRSLDCKEQLTELENKG